MSISYNKKKTGRFSFTFSVIVLGLVLACALSTLLIVPGGAATQDLGNRFLPVFSFGHVLGTDDLGRDVGTRLLYGTQSVILVGFVAVGFALILGTVSGFVAGFGSRVVDGLFDLFMNAILSIPTVLLCLAVIAGFGYGLVPVLVALAIVFTPVIHRIVRAEVQRLRHFAYVEVAVVMGRKRLAIAFDHMLPAIAPVLLVQASNLFAVAIGIESSLSYLGMGTQPPESSWGLMLRDAKDYLFTQPQLALIPGIALVVTILAVNFVGDRFAESQRLR